MAVAFDVKKRKNQHKGVIDFPQGLIGFSSAKRYALIEEPSSKRFVWLASVDRPDLSFLLVDPTGIFEGYVVEMNKQDLELLGLNSVNDAQVYAVVTLPRNASDATMNLRSPIVINEKTCRGMQVILEQGRYPTQHSFLTEGAPAKQFSKV
jgi:flagellar assembly factor FliW